MYISCWNARPVISYFCCWLLHAAADSIYFLLSLRKKFCIFPSSTGSFFAVFLFFSSFPSLSLSWLSCLLPLSPPPFTWFPVWYICLPSPCIPFLLTILSWFLSNSSFPCHLCKSVTSHFCLLEFFRQFSTTECNIWQSFLAAAWWQWLWHPSKTRAPLLGAVTARCKPGLISQLCHGIQSQNCLVWKGLLKVI